MITKLRTRILLWFLGAIVLAVVASSITVAVTRPPLSGQSGQVMARQMAARLSRMWDEPESCEAYVAEMREISGVDFKLRRDPENIPRMVLRAGKRGGALAFDGPQGAFIPIMRSGVVVGAVQFESGGLHKGWWRYIAALAAAIVVIGFGANQVAAQLARPLEQVEKAAKRFGSGDLSARVNVTGEGAGDEVRSVALAFDSMAERVERIVRDQRELLAAVSHEVRSPLARARVALEITRERSETREASGAPPLGRPLDDLERQLVAMDAILDDLLAVTRVGLSDLRREATPLLPWLRARIANEPNSPELVLEHSAAESDDPLVAIDPALLGRALHNLVENAQAHGHPAGQPLEVHVTIAKTRVEVAVRDRGPGISPDLLPRVFEPFVRGDTARSPGRGSTGLGLALVHRIVEAHGGESFARNLVEDGKITGAEVGFFLPRS
ncbi:MAG: ATP-binding protein [Polyangiaceae bacterium]